jgi:hypothetical protein
MARGLPWFVSLRGGWGLGFSVKARDLLGHPLWVQRLGEEGLEAAGKSLLAMNSIRERGERDGRRPFRCLAGKGADPAHELQPGHPRHGDITDDDVGADLRNNRQSLATAPRGRHSRPSVDKIQLQDIPSVLVVVHNQDMNAIQTHDISRVRCCHHVLGRAGPDAEYVRAEGWSTLGVAREAHRPAKLMPLSPGWGLARPLRKQKWHGHRGCPLTDQEDARDGVIPLLGVSRSTRSTGTSRYNSTSRASTYGTRNGAPRGMTR